MAGSWPRRVPGEPAAPFVGPAAHHVTLGIGRIGRGVTAGLPAGRPAGLRIVRIAEGAPSRALARALRPGR